MKCLYVSHQAHLVSDLEKYLIDFIHNVCVRAVLSHIGLFATPWTVARQAPVSVGFSGKECWSVLPCPSLAELLDPGIKPASLVSPELQGDFFFYHYATREALLFTVLDLQVSIPRWLSGKEGICQ